MSYQKVTADNGKQIKFDVRMKMFLLIQTDFNPLDEILFFEFELVKAYGIKRMDSVGRYDDTTGYVIYIINADIDINEIFKQVTEIFKEKYK